MKRFVCLILLSLLTSAALRAAEPVTSPEQPLVAALKDLQAQQAMIAENQAKIEGKLATIAEAVRVARIYSSRGGN